MNANDYLNKLVKKEDLTIDESVHLSGVLFDEKTTPVMLSSILTALKMKGESISEILGFTRTLRNGMNKISFEGQLIDTCGTGGDGQNTFNISSAAALVVAGAGVKTAKHGNRSASGSCGSADVFESLGVNIMLSSEGVKRCLRTANISFVFAPNFHPLMKTVSAVRRELKIRSIFNLLGPLVNPLSVKRQIIGVDNSLIAQKLSSAVEELSYEHVFIFHSMDGMDEISIYDKTLIYEYKNRKIIKILINPEEFNLGGKDRNEIKGNTIEECREKLLRVIRGEKGDMRNIVLLNSAAALYVSGKFKSISEGIKASEASIDSGKAMETLKLLIKSSKSN